MKKNDSFRVAAKKNPGYGKEFFESSCYRFRYMQAKDGTPVAQIYKWPWP